ncbi:reverse transcriptase domain-containing protein [Tanacetum coccineum]
MINYGVTLAGQLRRNSSSAYLSSLAMSNYDVTPAGQLRRKLPECMTRSSTKELVTAFKEPERVFHSTRRLFKTTSLDYSSSLEFDLFSDPENQSGEEVVNHVVDRTTLRIVHLKKKEKHLKKHTTFNLEYHSPKEKDIEQLLWDSTKELMEILRLGELTPTKLIIKLVDRTIKRPKGIAKNVLVGIDKFIFPIDFVVLDMPEDIKVPLILGRPFLSTTHAKIDVLKRKISLRVTNDKIVFKNDKLTSNSIKRVFALGLRERMELDLKARLMGEDLILNRSLDPTYGDYIEFNDLNEPLELRKNQVEDLGQTIEEGEVIDEPIEDIFETRNDHNEISNRINEYPSFCDFDRKIHIDCAYNLQFSCMIVMENMDAYRDEEMGDVIVGKPFCRETYVKARRFDGMINIYNGHDSVILSNGAITSEV